MVGIEPTTYGLRNRCSTTELHWRSVGVTLSRERRICRTRRAGIKQMKAAIGDSMLIVVRGRV